MALRLNGHGERKLFVLKGSVTRDPPTDLCWLILWIVNLDNDKADSNQCATISC